ncbi:hypothetical protein [Azospirillum soli]|uniref:hypothetical protein n=1 Tax=Azospirillum soli TaxID=1304799 RepID=UPI001AEB5474|nr:hypothetical protein [Azospirillum soli]MBP2316321.1 putative lipid-binding transport protein (Tim44 family) [Azospirillum soli]
MRDTESTSTPTATTTSNSQPVRLVGGFAGGFASAGAAGGLAVGYDFAAGVEGGTGASTEKPSIGIEV